MQKRTESRTSSYTNDNKILFKKKKKNSANVLELEYPKMDDVGICAVVVRKSVRGKLFFSTAVHMIEKNHNYNIRIYSGRF